MHCALCCSVSGTQANGAAAIWNIASHSGRGEKKEVTNHTLTLKSSNGNKTWQYISLAKTRHVVMPNFKVGWGSVILPWKSMSQDYLANHTSDHYSPKFVEAPCGKHHMLATLRCSCSRGQFFGIAPAQARSVVSLEALVKQTRACISQ